MNYEIERKWVLLNMPLLSRYQSESKSEIHQAYLLTKPFELRVRITQTKEYITIKSKGKLSRREWEHQIPKWLAKILSRCTPHSLQKTRYCLQCEQPKLELDVYAGRHLGLVVIEAEWTSQSDNRQIVETEALAYSLPGWLGGTTEVTYCSEYKNKTLARTSKPPKRPDYA